MKDKTRKFIDKAKKIHKNKYDYSLVEYISSKTKVKIICPAHGVFEQKPTHHLMGCNCQICSKINLGNDKKLSLKEFIKRAKKIHKNKYDYSLVGYVNSKTKIKIICPIHGIFEQEPYVHLKSNGCNRCSYEKRGIKGRITLEEFIRRAKKVHGDKYIYTDSKYKTLLEKIKIICPTHGPFEQEANSHLKGSGCRKCQISKGEEAVMNFLNFNNIHFLTQYSFEKCVNENKLLFDFYLPKQNICIEFDGIQHEKAISFFGGEEGLRKTKKRDQIKNLFCIESNIKLIRIKKIENIEKELLPLLK